MTKTAPISAIDEARGSQAHSGWTIGITNNPNRRRAEHGNPVVWHSWRADSEQVAKVERHFLELDPRIGIGVGRSQDRVRQP